MRAALVRVILASALLWAAPALAQPSATASGWNPTLEARCNAKDAAACWTLGEALLKGQGVAANPAKAVTAFVRACDLGVAEGCYIAANRVDLDKKGDAAGARALFIKGCEAGLGSSCLSSGIYTESGWGGAKDLPRALAFYERACTLRDGEACRYLGQIYAFGEPIVGGEKSGPKTLDWSVKGCHAGDGPSCMSASWIYAGSMGMRVDYVAGERYARMGCSLDHADSCSNLGYMIFKREDWTGARNAYARACQLPGGQERAASCSQTQKLDTYIAGAGAERARSDAKQSEGAAQIDRLMASGDYNGAMYKAAYDMGSIPQVNRILLAASSAGKLGYIDDIYFVAFGTWNISSQAQSIVTAEKRRRDAAQRQAARMAPVGGGSAFTWSSPSSSSLPSGGTTYTAPRISESEIYRNARENTRSTYCNAGWGCR